MGIVNSYDGMGEKAWQLDNPCSGFSEEAWNRSTGENLSCHYGPICNPTTLKESITKANGGIPHNTVAAGYRGPSSNSSNSLKAGSGVLSIRSWGSSL